MRKVKFVSMLVLLALLLSVVPGTVMGQEPVMRELPLALLAGESDYGQLTLQYPDAWRRETTIEQKVPFSDPDAIIRRETFTWPGGGIDLDVWSARGLQLDEWLDWYTETRYELPITQPNATIKGHPATVCVEDGGIKLLTTFVSDGKYVYRLGYTVGSMKGIQAYWEMLNAFTWSQEKGTSTQIPVSVKRNAQQTLQEAAGCSERGCDALYGQGCCGYSNSYCTWRFPCSRENGSDLGNCTYWACHRMPGQVPFHGDAWKWWYQVPDYPHWERASQPPFQQPSIAWWDKGSAPSFGHVAYAIWYGGDIVHRSHMAWCYHCVWNDTIGMYDTDGYIFNEYGPRGMSPEMR